MKRRRQRGKGLGGTLLKSVLGVIKPLFTKVVAKKVAKKAAQGIAEGAVSAGAEYGLKKIMAKGGRRRLTKRRVRRKLVF